MLDAQEFIERWERGQHGDYSEDEAVEQFRLVSQRLSADELRAVAREAYERQTADQRAASARLLRQAARISSIQTTISDDPDSLADITARLQRESPGGLIGLLHRFRRASASARNRADGTDGSIATGLGLGVGVGLGGGVVGGLLGAAAGRAIERENQVNDSPSEAHNPVAKEILAGMAAIGLKRIDR